MITLMEHQKNHAKFHLSKDLTLNLSEQGTGKTITAITTGLNKGFTILVICPLHLIPNWVDEFCQFNFDEQDIGVFNGTPSQRKKMKKRILSGEFPDIIVTNYDQFRIEVEFWMEYAKNEKLFTIVDECHTIGNWKSNITKQVTRFFEVNPYGLLMTGTPISNSPIKAYPLIKICLPYYFRNYYSFEKMFVRKEKILIDDPKYAGRKKSISIIKGYRNLPQLFKILEHIGVRIERDQCLDLPDRIFNIRKIDMIPEQRKMYRELKDDFYTILQSGEVIETTVVVAQITRLRQVASNPFSLDEDFQFEGKLLPKEKILLEDIKNYEGSKFVVFTNFRKTVERLEKVLTEAKIKFVSVQGGEKNLKEKLNTFKNDEECIVFLGNRQKCHTGLNLQHANVLINYELDYNQMHYSQGIDRIYRRGQERKVIVIDYVTKGSVEEVCKRSLDKKFTTEREVLDFFLDNIREKN